MFVDTQDTRSIDNRPNKEDSTLFIFVEEGKELYLAIVGGNYEKWNKTEINNCSDLSLTTEINNFLFDENGDIVLNTSTDTKLITQKHLYNYVCVLYV